jgi:hypothetical protein
MACRCPGAEHGCQDGWAAPRALGEARKRRLNAGALLRAGSARVAEHVMLAVRRDQQFSMQSASRSLARRRVQHRRGGRGVPSVTARRWTAHTSKAARTAPESPVLRPEATLPGLKGTTTARGRRRSLVRANPEYLPQLQATRHVLTPDAPASRPLGPGAFSGSVVDKETRQEEDARVK